MRILDTSHPLRLAMTFTLLTLAFGLGFIVADSAGAQSTSTCALYPDKVASPSELPLGETVRITLTVTATCESETQAVDVILVVDESASMQDAGKIENAKAAASEFLGAMDLDQSRVGLVTFTNGGAALRVGLTHDGDRVQRGVDQLFPGGLTNISAAIELARKELTDNGRAEARKAMVVLTDGRQTQPGAEPVEEAAARAKAEDITIATFCAGEDCDPGLQSAASSPNLHFEVDDMSDLPDLYRDLAGTLQENGIATLTIRDELPTNMTYVAGSAVPAPAEIRGQVLIWRFNGLPPEDGIVYDVIPTEVGLHPTNVQATAEFTDKHGKPGEAPFPVPQVRVYDPECQPQPLEVFFLIDDSNCLYGQLLNGKDAKSAIRDGVEVILDQMDLTEDKAAVIGFGDRARVFQNLTSDRDAILAGVDAISMRDGSARLDLAFDEVAKELTQERHDPDAQVATLTITDGPMMQRPESAKDRAQALKNWGVKHYAIGVGFITQHAVLRAISEPDGYYEIPFGGDVISPMGTIGETVVEITNGCPPDPQTGTATPTPEEPNRDWRAVMPRLLLGSK